MHRDLENFGKNITALSREASMIPSESNDNHLAASTVTPVRPKHSKSSNMINLNPNRKSKLARDLNIVNNAPSK